METDVLKLTIDQTLLLFKFLYEFNQIFKNYLKDYKCDFYSYYNGYIIPGSNKNGIYNNLVTKLKSEKIILKNLDNKPKKKEKEYLSILDILINYNFTIKDIELFNLHKNRKKFLNEVIIKNNELFQINSEYSNEYMTNFLNDENYFSKWITQYNDVRNYIEINNFKVKPKYESISEIIVVENKEYHAILSMKDLFIKNLNDLSNLRFFVKDFNEYFILVVETNFNYFRTRQFYKVIKL